MPPVSESHYHPYSPTLGSKDCQVCGYAEDYPFHLVGESGRDYNLVKCGGDYDENGVCTYDGRNADAPIHTSGVTPEAHQALIRRIQRRAAKKVMGSVPGSGARVVPRERWTCKLCPWFHEEEQISLRDTVGIEVDHTISDPHKAIQDVAQKTVERRARRVEAAIKQHMEETHTREEITRLLQEEDQITEKADFWAKPENVRVTQGESGDFTPHFSLQPSGPLLKNSNGEPVAIHQPSDSVMPLHHMGDAWRSHQYVGEMVHVVRQQANGKLTCVPAVVTAIAQSQDMGANSFYPPRWDVQLHILHNGAGKDFHTWWHHDTECSPGTWHPRNECRVKL